MSSIEWTGSTWNPILGCTKISAGCRRCYAVDQAFRNWEMAKGLPEDKRGRLAYYDGLTEKTPHGRDWTGKLVFVPEALEIPLKRKKTQTYFVNSMSDMFHSLVEDEWLDQIFAVMALTPQHTYQILTKRPERMRDYLSDRFLAKRILDTAKKLNLNAEMIVPIYPYKHIWVGVSVENQKSANERIPLLLNTPAAVRFLSCEPLLEGLNLSSWLPIELGEGDWWHDSSSNKSDIDWVIVGGESGGGSRPCNVDWRSPLSAIWNC